MQESFLVSPENQTPENAPVNGGAPNDGAAYFVEKDEDVKREMHENSREENGAKNSSPRAHRWQQSSPKTRELHANGSSLSSFETKPTREKRTPDAPYRGIERRRNRHANAPQNVSKTQKRRAEDERDFSDSAANFADVIVKNATTQTSNAKKSRQKKPRNAQLQVDESSTRLANAAPAEAEKTAREKCVLRADIDNRQDELRGENTSAKRAKSSDKGAPLPGFLRNLLVPSPVWNRNWEVEEQREEAFACEMLELFRQRVRLVSLLAMLGLAIYAAFYIYLEPRSATPLLIAFGLLFSLAAAGFVLVRVLPSISAIRILSLTTYALYSAGAAVILSIMGQGHGYILGGHNHIVLTTLLLPLMSSECLIIGVIAFFSLAFSSWFSLVPGQQSLFYSHLFGLANTTVFVIVIAHFQNLLRRHAFDSAFDTVISAARFQNLSVKDSLTGGYNRRHLEQTLDLELARGARFGRPLSLIMFDLDNFKRVNDSKGHAAGDRVLNEIWQVACGCVRNVDTAARYGGDEFAIILPETDENAAFVVARRLKETARAHLREVFGKDSPEAQVTLSIGFTTVRPTRALPGHEVIAQADDQLYAAKRNGKNNIVG